MFMQFGFVIKIFFVVDGVSRKNKMTTNDNKVGHFVFFSIVIFKTRESQLLCCEV